MPLKRKYTVTLTYQNYATKSHEVEAESMKTVDGNIVLMDFDEEGCRFNEVAFFSAPSGGTINVTSVNL